MVEERVKHGILTAGSMECFVRIGTLCVEKGYLLCQGMGEMDLLEDGSGAEPLEKSVAWRSRGAGKRSEEDKV